MVSLSNHERKIDTEHVIRYTLCCESPKEEIAPKVAADQAYRNAKLNTPNTARLEHDKALARVMLTLLKDDTEAYKQFVQNESFKRFVSDMVFNMTSTEVGRERFISP